MGIQPGSHTQTHLAILTVWPGQKEFPNAKLVTSTHRFCRFSEATEVEIPSAWSVVGQIVSFWPSVIRDCACRALFCWSQPGCESHTKQHVRKSTGQNKNIYSNRPSGYDHLRCTSGPFSRVITAQLALSASFRPTKLFCLYIVRQAGHENGNRRCRLLSSGTKAQRSREGENANVKTGIIIT